MKKVKQIVFGSLFMLSGMIAFSQANPVSTVSDPSLITSTFTVSGNCSACQGRIEGAANGIEGVKEAHWNVDSKVMQVSYYESKTSLDLINLAIAKAGYDTQYYKSDDKDYKKLPGCCQYERKDK